MTSIQSETLSGLLHSLPDGPLSLAFSSLSTRDWAAMRLASKWGDHAMRAHATELRLVLKGEEAPPAAAAEVLPSCNEQGCSGGQQLGPPAAGSSQQGETPAEAESGGSGGPSGSSGSGSGLGSLTLQEELCRAESSPPGWGRVFGPGPVYKSVTHLSLELRRDLSMLQPSRCSPGQHDMTNDIVLNICASLPQLRRLSIGSHERWNEELDLDVLGPGLASLCPALQDLRLGGAAAYAVAGSCGSLSQLSHLTRLEVLSVFGEPLLPSLSSLRCLRELHLGKLDWGKTAAAALASLTALTALDIYFLRYEGIRDSDHPPYEVPPLLPGSCCNLESLKVDKIHRYGALLLDSVLAPMIQQAGAGLRRLELGRSCMRALLASEPESLRLLILAAVTDLAIEAPDLKELNTSWRAGHTAEAAAGGSALSPSPAGHAGTSGPKLQSLFVAGNVIELLDVLRDHRAALSRLSLLKLFQYPSLRPSDTHTKYVPYDRRRGQRDEEEWVSLLSLPGSVHLDGVALSMDGDGVLKPHPLLECLPRIPRLSWVRCWDDQHNGRELQTVFQKIALCRHVKDLCFAAS